MQSVKPTFQGSNEVLDEKCDTSDKESVDSATGSTASKDDSPVRKRQMLKKGMVVFFQGNCFK